MVEIIDVTANPAYLADIVRLLHQQMTDIGSDRSLEQIRLALENALKPEARTRFFLLKVDDTAAGLAFLNICSGIESGGDYIWLNEIQITVPFRKKGYGRQLLAHIRSWAKSQGYRCILGITSNSNHPSRQLFQAGGFDISDCQWLACDL